METGERVGGGKRSHVTLDQPGLEVDDLGRRQDGQHVLAILEGDDASIETLVPVDGLGTRGDREPAAELWHRRGRAQRRKGIQ